NFMATSRIKNTAHREPIDQKVLTLAQNILTLRDVRTRKIKEDVIKELEKAKTTPCFFLRAGDGMIHFVFQPRNMDDGEPSGVDFFNPGVVLFFKGCERDDVWLYHPNVMSSPGRARITRSQLMRYRPDGEEYPDVCFSFCGDLRRPKYTPNILRGTDKILVSDAETEFKEGHLPCSSIKPEGCNEYIPELALLREGTKDDLTKSLASPDNVYFFLYPQDHKPMKDKWYSSFYQPNDKGYDGKPAAGWDNAYQAWLPGCFNEQPHLIAAEYSSVQFYFQRKLITSANLNQVMIYHDEGDGKLKHGIKGKKRGEDFGAAKHVMKYRVKTRASIEGICYHFETGASVFRVELKVSGHTAGKDVIMSTIRRVQKGLTAVAYYIKNSKVSPVENKKEQDASKTGANSSTSLAGAFKAIKEASSPKEGAGIVLGRSVQRASLFLNTINIDYDFGEFYNRSEKNPFEIRFEYSDQLFDNLYNNNNASVAQEIDVRFKCLNNIVYQEGATSSVIFYRRDTFDTDFPSLKLRHSQHKSFMPGMTSSDPQLQGGLAEITGDKGDEDLGQTNQPRVLISTNDELADGHHHGCFELEFSKPVKYFYDVYTCIGRGAMGQFNDLHSGYNGGRKEVPPTHKPFTKAYGFIPSGGVITWKFRRETKGGVKIDKINNLPPFEGVTNDIIPDQTFDGGDGDFIGGGGMGGQQDTQIDEFGFDASEISYLDVLEGQDELERENIDEAQDENVDAVESELYEAEEIGDEDTEEQTSATQDQDQSTDQDAQQLKEEQEKASGQEDQMED
ncbi:23617_t:CDS:10, partial [Racocetra persica]